MKLAAIDCADEANQQVCSDFGITGFPTLKVRAVCAGHFPVPWFPCALPFGLSLCCSIRLTALLHQNVPFGALQAGAASPFPKT